MGTRYDTVVELNFAKAEQLRVSRDACQVAASILMQQYANYLGTPPEAIQYCKLNRDLLPTDEVGPVQKVSPVFTPGPDAFWYFGLRHHLVRSTGQGHTGLITACLGIQKRPESFVLRATTDMTFTPEANPSLSNATVDAVCEALFRSLQARVATPLAENESPQVIGFRPNP